MSFSKIKKCLLLIIILLLSSLSIYLSIEPLYIPTALVTPSKLLHFPRFIAHKAIISGDYTGNTIEAIQESLGSHVEAIEVDVRLSKDHVPFLYHAETLEELTNGKGKPEDFTWIELEELSYNNQDKSRLVRLEEVLKQVGSQKFIFLDIKTTTIIDSSFAKELVRLIHKYHLEETIIVESFNPFFLTMMRLEARDILLMYDFTTNAKALGEEKQTQFNQIPWLLKQPFIQKQIRRIVRPDFLGPRWNLEENLLKHLIEKGYPLFCWTLDDSKIATHLFDLGVKGIQTNDSRLLMKNIPDQNTHKIYDAGGSESLISKIIYVKSVQDILDGLFEAKLKHLPVTIAGRRHSMGAQTLLDQSVQFDMLGLNQVTYNQENQTVTVQAGATWKKIQKVLDLVGRSVQIMQSDNIFTVGGSLSVNVHGWQVGTPPISSSVVALKVITADGKMLRITPQDQAELFSSILGGYGQFGIIVEAELKTVSNSMLKFSCEFMNPKEFNVKFAEKVTQNPAIELAYGRLSVDPDHLFEEAGLFWYERVDSPLISSIDQEKLVAFKRAIFRASQYTAIGKKIRWAAEKTFARHLTTNVPVSRNTVMNSDVHILWPLYGQSKDILHEYFVPKYKLVDFLDVLKSLVLSEKMNLLNVTIREVRKDSLTALPYAKEDVFGFVLLFSQNVGDRAELHMQRFTQKLIDAVLKLKGTFYLPYRLHYTSEQLLESYPSIYNWMKIKEKWDPESVFDSVFFRYLKKE